MKILENTSMRDFSFFLFAIFLILGIFLSNCKKFKNENPDELFSLVFAEGGKRNPSIVFHKEVNVDLTPENELVYIIRNGNEEILVITDNTGMNLLFKKVFTLLNMGPIRYDNKTKKWLSSLEKVEANKLYIIQNIFIEKIGENSFYSIFLEILSEEPPLELFSIPLVYSNYILVFDGFSLFKETELLEKLNRIPFSFVSEKKGIQVLSAVPAFNKFYSLE